ncbi:hypothetical protein OHV05_04315 [Kitasatospora sp. NBC_00070]|uniref:hypothetical protein n=1 Tax=Kitasatospora sp. NBC_00070 TaxID=2975962 RepID=UPI003251E009
MADEQTTPDPAAQTDQGPDETTAVAPAGPADDGERDEAALPAWARTELETARASAAKLTEVQAALTAAKTPEEYEAATARITALEGELHRERLGRTYNLPAVFADLITGADEDEREAHAKDLAKAFHTRTTTLGTGGLTPGTPSTPTDPVALAALVTRSRA